MPTYQLEYKRQQDDGGWIEIIRVSNAEGVVVIPDTIDGLPVRDVSAGTFMNCDKVTDVILPEGIDGVWTRTFENCTGLRTVHLPSTVAVISDGAFINCTSLVHINLPQALTEIGVCAFKGCVRLSHAEFPEGLQYIQASAFRNCKSLKRITLPGSLVHLEQKAFDGCKQLQHVTVRGSDTRIAEGAFTGCDRLQAFSIESEFPSYVFTKDMLIETADRTLVCFLTKGREEIEIPGRLANAIGDFAFSGNRQLRRVVIGEGVESIGCRSFFRCSNLEEVCLPKNSLVKIEEEAFRGCGALRNFDMPESVKSVGYETFKGCPSELAAYNRTPEHPDKHWRWLEMLCDYMDRRPSRALLYKCGYSDDELYRLLNRNYILFPWERRRLEKLYARSQYRKSHYDEIVNQPGFSRRTEGYAIEDYGEHYVIDVVSPDRIEG